MTERTLDNARRAPARGGAAGLVAVAALAVAALAPSAAIAALPECADTVAPAALAPGQPAVGHTVRVGETPESFDVVILGVLEDGIAPGRDLIVVDTSGPVIDAGGGGISAGMSGSPVYTLGGELIGSVSFGLSAGPSSIGGVTVADDMLALLDEPAAQQGLAAAAPASVSLGPGIRRRIAERTGVSRAEVGTAMRRLQVPLAISGGIHPRHLDEIESRLPGSYLVTTGASDRSAGGPPFATVAPGDAFAGVFSYGDVSAAAIGTATYVCDGEALAFGHPLSFLGPTLLGASRASVITVVPDPLGVPYKLSEITDPLGAVTLDRLQGVRASLGVPVATIPITQTTRALDTGVERIGALTEAVGGDDELLPIIVLIHALSNIDSTFNQFSGGSARVTFTIRGTTSAGRAWSYRRTNRHASTSDISFAAVFELLDTMLLLQAQDLARIRFTGVEVDVSIEETPRRFRIAKVLWAGPGGKFRDTRRLRVRAGAKIRARVLLRSLNAGPSRRITMAVRAPRRSGEVSVLGGGSLGFGGLLRARSFRQLLQSLRAAPRNNQLLALSRPGRSNPRRASVQHVVSGRDSVRVLISGRKGRKGKGPLPPSLFD